MSGRNPTRGLVQASWERRVGEPLDGLTSELRFHRSRNVAYGLWLMSYGLWLQVWN